MHACLYDISTKAKNTTDLLRADWLYTLFNWVSCIAERRRQLSCVGEGVYSDATQLNSTRRRVELHRYKRSFKPTVHFELDKAP